MVSKEIRFPRFRAGVGGAAAVEISSTRSVYCVIHPERVATLLNPKNKNEGICRGCVVFLDQQRVVGKLYGIKSFKGLVAVLEEKFNTRVDLDLSEH